MIRIAVLFALLLASACKKKLAHDLPPELEKLAAAYDQAESRHTKVKNRDGTEFEMPPSSDFFDPEDPIVAPTGLYIHKRKVAELAALADPAKVRELLAGAPNHPEPGPQDPNVVFVIYSLHSIIVYPDVPGAAVRAIVEGAADLGWKHVWIGDLDERGIDQVCGTDLARAANPGREASRVVSIDVESDRVWIGQSAGNEFYEVPNKDNAPDVEKIEISMRELLVDECGRARTPSPRVEIGIAGAISRDNYLAVLRSTCSEVELITLVPVDRLTTRPKL